MAKRKYLQGEARRKINRSVWLSEAEAEWLRELAKKTGKSESQLARLAVLKVLADVQSTAAIVTDDGIVAAQPMLFEPVSFAPMTTEMGAG